MKIGFQRLTLLGSVCLTVLISCMPGYAKPAEKEAALASCKQLFGPVVDEKQNLFPVNQFYVLRATFDSRGRLQQLAIEPKYFFESTHPDWEEPAGFANLSRIEYEALLKRIDTIKPKGTLISSSTYNVVAGRDALHKKIYAKATVIWGEVVDLRRGDNAPTEVRWFQVDYQKNRSRSQEQPQIVKP